MKKWIKENSKIFRKIIIVLSLILLIVIFSLLQLSPVISEWWTRTIARYYQTGIGFIFKYLPFSFAEIAAITAIGFAIFLIIKIIIDLVKKRFLKALNKSLIIAISILSLVAGYMGTTSFSYFREELPVALYKDKVDKSKFSEVVQYYLDDFNLCASNLTFKENGEVNIPYSINKLFENIALEYEKLDDPYYSSFTTNPKPMLTSFLYVQFQITGMYVGFTGEVNYDVFMTNGEHPFTLAHELAHSKGVMRENDAQLLAAYICLNSEDYFIRYSGYLYTFSSILNLMNYTGVKDDYSNMYKQMDKNILANYRYINKFWDEHNLLEAIGEFFNNLYLNLFGKESTDDYQDPPPQVDDSTQEITYFSRYQQLMFQKYIDDGHTLK